MDYTQSNSFVTDAGTTQRMHLAGQAVPTAVSDNDMNQVIWELMEIVKAGGLAGAPFDKAVPATYQKLLLALRAAGVFTTPAQFDNTTRAATAQFVRVFGASFSGVLTISAAGALPNAAVGGQVKLAGTTYTSTLPLASAVPAGGRISFHVTASGAITLARAGADTISPPVGAAVTLLVLLAGDTLDLTSNGVSDWLIAGGSAALPIPGSQKFTAGGTFTVPRNVTTVYVTMSGGGGGGGGAAAANRGGGGGGAHAVIKQAVAVTPGAAIAVTVGAAGVGGAANINGTAGGTSSFGALVSCPGGAGGIEGSAGTGGDAGGLGGAFGQQGAIGGQGGGSIFGPGGNNALGIAGYRAGGHGGGGGGGAATNPGAVGSIGFVSLEW